MLTSTTTRSNSAASNVFVHPTAFLFRLSAGLFGHTRPPAQPVSTLAPRIYFSYRGNVNGNVAANSNRLNYAQLSKLN